MEFKILERGAGRKTYWLSTLTALSEGPISLPSTHRGRISNSSARSLMLDSDLISTNKQKQTALPSLPAPFTRAWLWSKMKHLSANEWINETCIYAHSKLVSIKFLIFVTAFLDLEVKGVQKGRAGLSHLHVKSNNKRNWNKTVWKYMTWET